MPKVYLFRHAQTDDNANHIFSGTRDVTLNETGIKQAYDLQKLLAEVQVDVAFSSPMRRTVETISIALKRHTEVKVCLDPRIRERSYGELQGKNKDDIARESLPLFKLYHRSYYTAPPKGESLYSVDMRVRPFIRDLVKNLNEFNYSAAICAHSNSMRGMRIFFEQLPQSAFNKIETSVGQLFVYDIEGFSPSDVTF
ncbi:MAG: histidine phosphatase family protein [Candidatus Dojkabacteria bacterium]|nr:MAG: histidine phosphatase family protein [Candidatus Dojkabacteria bacterium]